MGVFVVCLVDEMAGRVVDQQGRRLDAAPSAAGLRAERHQWLRQGRLPGGDSPVLRVRRVRRAEVGLAQRPGPVLGAKGRLLPGNSQAVVAETRPESHAGHVHRRPDRLQPETVYVETG